MIDGVFFINNALKVNQLSVYTNEERFQQTLETMASIDRYCPSNKKYMFDSSPEEPPREWFDELHRRGVDIFWNGDDPLVKQLSLSGQRSLSETLTFQKFIDTYKPPERANRIYKLSGRYQLNRHFVISSGENDSITFSRPLDSWMSLEAQERAGVNRLYRLRLWHMDASLLPAFAAKLEPILHDCVTYGIDIEHSYYKHLQSFKRIEVEKIGVCGTIAPSGEYIEE